MSQHQSLDAHSLQNKIAQFEWMLFFQIKPSFSNSSLAFLNSFCSSTTSSFTREKKCLKAPAAADAAAAAAGDFFDSGEDSGCTRFHSAGILQLWTIELSDAQNYGSWNFHVFRIMNQRFLR